MKQLISVVLSALLVFSIVPLAAAESETTQETLAMLEAVNINSADAEALTQLEGVGPARAEQIVAWREANGEFTSVEQLLEIRGIGPATLEKNRERLRLE